MVEEETPTPHVEANVEKEGKISKGDSNEESQREERIQEANSLNKVRQTDREEDREAKEKKKKEQRIQRKEEKKQEKIREKFDQYHSRSLSSSAYYSSLSSFSSENERQISVDPISLTEIGMLEDDAPLSVPSVFTEVVVHSPILPPLRTPRFVSASLPCSANSSPQYSFSNTQKWDEPNYMQPRQVDSPRTLARQHSLALSRFSNGRSKSFAEGRTFSHNDTFEVLGRRRYSAETFSSSSNTSPESPKPKPKPKTKGTKEDDFKCGVLCMNLPAFTKKKPLQQLRQQVARASGVSRLASLEKFDCGSWSPPRNVDYQEDMPVEMERNSGDAETPVRTAFMFDGIERRGILKKSTSQLGSAKSLGSSASNRHVRFSVSHISPASCPASPSALSMSISPRLRKVREEFTAFLEAAQGA